MKFKLYIAFGREATDYVDDHGWKKGLKSRKDEVQGNVHLKSFNTHEERAAYIQGVEDANGWMNDPSYTTFEDENEKQKDHAHSSN